MGQSIWNEKNNCR